MEKENCLYLQVAHCNKCGGESGYNIYDGEKVCFDCGEPYKADFSVSKVESTITTTNTQPQAEEKTKLVMPPSAYEQAEKEGFNMKNKVKSELLPESTPEQKEEWEFDLRNLMYRDGEQLRCAGEGKPYTGEYRELVVSMIKNLLSEREKEAREEGFREGADIVESDYIRKVKKLEKRLSKLTTK